MRKTLLFILATVALCAFVSCGANKEMVTSTSRTAEAIVRPVMADLEISDKKIEHAYTMQPPVGSIFATPPSSNSFFGQRTNDQDALLQEYAVYEALKTAQGDVLVCPQYKIVRKLEENMVRHITVYVTGYVGKYSNFRAATPAPAEIIELKGDATNLVVIKDLEGNPVSYKVVSATKGNTVEFNIGDSDVESVTLGKKHKRQ